MYLSRLYIRNFRSISELDLEFCKGKNVIIGRNNAGKSNIIRALDLVLGESSPTYAKNETPGLDDFYTEEDPFTEDPERRREIIIWCELTREKDEPLDPLVANQRLRMFQGMLSPPQGVQDDTISRSFLPKKCELIFSIDPDAESTRAQWFGPRYRATSEQVLRGKYSFAYAFRAWINDKNEITRDLRFLFRQDQEHDWSLSFVALTRNELLQSAIIPAFRDPQSQLRLSSWSWYGRLMRHLVGDQKSNAKLAEARTSLRAAASQVFAAAEQRVNESIEVAFPGTRLSLRFGHENGPELYRSCVLYAYDGVDAPLAEKGSGIQSAAIIGLFTYYTQAVNAKGSALLCLEEPELYLHPHAQRVISGRLDAFLAGGRNQVILSSHSPEFIRSTSPDLNVVVVRKDVLGTKAKPISLRHHKDLLVQRGLVELFFAEKAILCEGLDEYIVRMVANEACPGELDAHNISIIGVGGKDSLSHVSQLVLRLGVKCFILADFDYMLRDEGPERETYGQKARKSIVSLGAKFFCQPCIMDKDGSRHYAGLNTLRQQIKRDHERAFYTAKSVTDIPALPLAAVLERLRTNGVCILDGEIEGLCIDPEFVSPTNKLSMDKIFALAKRVSEGESIRGIFDTRVLEDFLHTVLSR